MKQEKEYQARGYRDLKELMADVTVRYADHNAFIVKNKEEGQVSYTNISFMQLGREIDGLGTALLKRGFSGKRIAVIGKNRYDWFLTYMAVINGVGIIVPLDKDLPDQELLSLLQRSRADAIVLEEKYLEQVHHFFQAGVTQLQLVISMDPMSPRQQEAYPEAICLKNLLQEGAAALEAGDTAYQTVTIDPDAMATIIFTSGTTSLSKAVMLSHGNIAANLYDLACKERIYDTDVNMAFLPYHHTFGSTGQLFITQQGACSVYCDGLRYVQNNLKEYHVSVFVCVPLLLEGMYQKIMRQVEKQGKTRLVKTMRKVCRGLLKVGIDIRRIVFREILEQLGGKLRFAVSGASAIDIEVLQALNDFGILALQGYGLTETSPVLAAEWEVGRNLRYGSVGLPMPSVTIRIDDPDENGIGEIVAKGPNVMLGYYENEEATKEVLQDGWFHTGDLGYYDKDGYLFITGRKKNMIVLKNGKKVFPEEMEILINALPYVAESMVFGWPTEDGVELAVKIVYDKEYTDREFPGLSETRLKDMIWKDIKEVNHTLSRYKWIQHLIVTSEPMIKTSTAKIKRHEELKTILIDK